MIISNLTSRLLRPFANAGAKATIPLSQTDATRASYEQGFPALNMTPIAAGGVPPSGQDFNGILYDLSNAALWQQAAGILPWSAEFAQSQVSGGYPKNALVVHNAMLYQSSVDNNTETPGAGTNWQGVGVSNASQPQHAVTLRQMQDEQAKYAPLMHPRFTKMDSDLRGGAIRLQATDNQRLGDLSIDYYGDGGLRIYTANKGGGAYINLGRVALNEWWDLIPPAGSILIMATSWAPPGYLRANGAAVSRTAYATLFATIGTTYGAGDGSTTFNLPDLRGEFIRGWDDGRGVDPGRAIGTYQEDAMQAWTSEITYQRAEVDGSETTAGATEFVRTGQGSATPTGLGWAVAHVRMGPGVKNVARTAAETRPRNVALLPCIKY